jgi:hypothetical protein
MNREAASERAGTHDRVRLGEMTEAVDRAEYAR